MGPHLVVLNLSGTDLRQASLNQVDLSRSEPPMHDLSGSTWQATMIRVSLCRADLRGVDLTDDRRRKILSGASLNQAFSCRSTSRKDSEVGAPAPTQFISVTNLEAGKILTEQCQEQTWELRPL